MKKGYSVLFADADNTLFDFNRAEAHSFALTMQKFGLVADEALCARYHEINDSLWKALERGETTQPKLRIDRFRLLMEAYSLDIDPVAIATCYTDYLGASAFLLPDALECVKRWSSKVPVYLVTNGISDVQRGRLSRSEIKPYIRDIIISQEVGTQKPDPKMMEAALAVAGNPDKREVLMLGDSLSSDIRGAINAGLDSCYFNPKGTPNTSGVTPTYEIRSLREVGALLGLEDEV